MCLKLLLLRLEEIIFFFLTTFSQVFFQTRSLSLASVILAPGLTSRLHYSSPATSVIY